MAANVVDVDKNFNEWFAIVVGKCGVCEKVDVPLLVSKQGSLEYMIAARICWGCVRRAMLAVATEGVK